MEAIEFLYPFANKRMLSVIQRGKVPRVYYQMLADALRNARVQGPAIITELGEIDNPDMIAEVADLAAYARMRRPGPCAPAIWNDKLLISIRTSEESNLAEKVIKHIVARKGTGGGHQTYAGGQISLVKGTKKEREELEKHVERKFLEAIGVEEGQNAPLVSA